MTILNILTYPNQNLKKKANPVYIINDEILKNSKDMIETMIHNNGIGLAATQVNINKKIIVILINKKINPIIMINPKIIYKKGITITTEGCLSFPDFFIKVKRNKIIRTSFTDLNNKKKTLMTDNLLSICIQHEIDHLNGITLYDKISNLKKKLIKK